MREALAAARRPEQSRGDALRRGDQGHLRHDPPSRGPPATDVQPPAGLLVRPRGADAGSLRRRQRLVRRPLARLTPHWHSSVRTMPLRTKTRTSAPPVTATEVAVLGLLADGERSGYDLLREAERSVGFFWTPAK